MIEFYNTANELVTTVTSNIVPPVGALISIRKVTWKVTNVSYAVDHSDLPISERKLVAAVQIAKVARNKK